MRTTEKVTVRVTKHVRYSHVVRWPGADGKRIAKPFNSLTDAESWAKDRRAELGDVGESFGSMTELERSALVFWREFVKKTTPTPPDLQIVMKDFQTSWLASKASVTVTLGIDGFIKDQEANGSSPRHLASLRSRLGRFSAEHGEKIVSSITTGIFRDWLNGLEAIRADKLGEKMSTVTRHNFTRSLRSFFVFAVERGWTLSNPIPLAKRSKSKAHKLATRTAPAIMLPVDVERFMKAVAGVAPNLVPFWALKFFAGIRDAEVPRMTWSMIDLDEGKIHLPAHASKTGEARTVKIEPNLKAWLLIHTKRKGPVAPSENVRKSGFKKVIASLVTKDGDGKVVGHFIFPSNAARHSFGSYHLFHFRNAGETALQLGHKGNPAMLHEHYKNARAEKHAAAFWKIRPEAGPANVIPFTAGGTPVVNWPAPHDLQTLLWSKPTREIANSLGVSDKAVEKHAKKHGLTKPPRGYWQKNRQDGQPEGAKAN